ncbi:MarR family transcriptional regulator [uncultured Methylobacterium sp.]|jgi:DNA-binding MarR family transcriptional regulator|uniref:MarR family winged helix-turn-helix transcriptional regulator n=1 Tax=uncultured Methylobacterium sp. TaxID=157278 RepID=UPI002610A32F|nr:MarR family transcriptional regulator [uncultured Methylobacterium sp.]
MAEDDTPLVNPMEARLGYQLRRASAALMAGLAEALVPLDLRITEATVLMVLAENRNATQSALGRLLGIKRANMAPLVARLAARGLIDRAPVDRRSHGLHLTPEGERLAAAAFRATAEYDGRFFGGDPDPQELRARLQVLWGSGAPEDGDE